MQIQDLIDQLKERRQDFSDITEFSANPGIYAIFSNSGRLPHIDRQIPESEIIYIGMTTVSQAARDAKTHFASGRTGSSTVRRSLAALLRIQLSLTPIPRSANEARKKYKFDIESELKLTDWMVANLALSYFDYRESKSAIEALEKRIIKTLVPIINLYKNLENPYRELIRRLRKECRSIAQKSRALPKPQPEPLKSSKVRLTSNKK